MLIPLGLSERENLANSMRSVARQIWDEQVEAVRVGHKYSEETITERVAVLLEQALVTQQGVHVRTFNRHEEGNKKTGNGADLALWVQLATGLYGFHFQAKSRLENESFASFTPGGRQHLQLLGAAALEDANPAYLFYPAPNRAAGVHHPAQDLRDFGCAATAAYSRGEGLVPESADFRILANSWAPWHTFVFSTMWIGDGKSSAWLVPEARSPETSPIRADQLPDYLETAVLTGRSYTKFGGTSSATDPRPQRTILIEGNAD